LDVIIHIGKQKTGSTAIQTRLFAVRDQLARRGVVYSKAFGKKKAQNLKNVFRSGRSVKGGDAGSMSAAFEAELARKPGMLILSNENLFAADRDVRVPIRDMIVAAGGRPKIYAYVRRPVDHAASLYQQRVRTGEKTWSIDEFLEAMIDKKYYNFANYLDEWADVFGRDAIHVRLFHREILKEGPFEDFVDWIGVSTRGIRFPDPKAEKPKESFDAGGVDVLRFFRKYDDEHPGVFDERFLEGVRHRIRHSNSGRRLTLTAAQAHKICEATRPDLERLADGYLTPREAELLLAPSKASGPGAQSDAYDLISRALDVIGDLGKNLGLPDGNATPDPSLPLDPPAQELLDILKAYAAEAPDRLDAATIVRAERLLRERSGAEREPEPEEPAPEPESEPVETEAVPLTPEQELRRARRARRVPSAEYPVFCRLVEICVGLGTLSKPQKENRSAAVLDRRKRRVEWRRRKHGRDAAAAGAEAPAPAAVPSTTIAAVAEPPVAGLAATPAVDVDREERRRRRQERRAQQAAATEAGLPPPITKRQERMKRREERKAASAGAQAAAEVQPA
jgi:hypothetical protein